MKPRAKKVTNYLQLLFTLIAVSATYQHFYHLLFSHNCILTAGQYEDEKKQVTLTVKVIVLDFHKVEGLQQSRNILTFCTDYVSTPINTGSCISQNASLYHSYIRVILSDLKLELVIFHNLLLVILEEDYQLLKKTFVVIFVEILITS